MNSLTVSSLEAPFIDGLPLAAAARSLAKAISACPRSASSRIRGFG